MDGATERVRELSERIRDYLAYREQFLSSARRGLESARKQAIMAALGASETDWNSWRWQMRHRLMDVETLVKVAGINPKVATMVGDVGKKFRWTVSPHYGTLIDPANPLDPTGLMVLPTRLELSCPGGEPDPMAEEATSPAPCITQRYPDRLVLNVTNVCPSFCRFCQRRRNIGGLDTAEPRERLEQGLAYIRGNPAIRDVLVTGGDPLTLDDATLEWILGEIRQVSHVEIIRIGTRVLATMPQRVTPELCQILHQRHPVYVSTHFNHPLEITEDTARSAGMLADAGVPMNNQSVLLNGINNHPYIIKLLNQMLLSIRVKPYYLFHPKPVLGTMHFACSIDDGLAIMEELRGTTSGLAIPTYVVNAPGGLGKMPIFPEYVISRGPGYVVLRTWEGKTIRYPNHETRPLSASEAWAEDTR
jgi:lysine 2,3-aminomutase